MNGTGIDALENRITLVLSEPLKLRQQNIRIIKTMSDQEISTIYVTTNQPYRIVRNDCEKAGVNQHYVYYIDAITTYASGREPEPTDHCIFINNPANLTNIGIAISELLGRLGTDKVCVLLDSVNSILIYISSGNLIKFIHFISNKLRLLDVSGIYLAIEKGIDPDVLLQLESLVDEIREESGPTPPPAA